MTNFSRRILITGGGGQLAQALANHSLAQNHQLLVCDKQILNILDRDAINQIMLRFKPGIVINTAAFTAVDQAEHESSSALEVNHIGAQQLAIACRDSQVQLIHLSTDYIFNGEKNSPYSEDDLANPINVYGNSKWLGEQAVRLHHPQHLILRISGVFSEYGKNFLKTILRLANEQTELRIVADQITCPTYAGDIAGAIYTIIEKPWQTGTYHYCSAQPVSWYEFASAIVPFCHPIPTFSYPSPAKRPLNSVLDCSKIKRDFGIEQPSWKVGIKKALKGLMQ